MCVLLTKLCVCVFENKMMYCILCVCKEEGKKMQNPKIKLFYILTVKTIKDIYIMNEMSSVDYAFVFCYHYAL